MSRLGKMIGYLGFALWAVLTYLGWVLTGASTEWECPKRYGSCTAAEMVDVPWGLSQRIGMTALLSCGAALIAILAVLKLCELVREHAEQKGQLPDLL